MDDHRATPPVTVKGSRGPSMRSRRHSSLFFNQHHSSAPGLFVLCTQHCCHIHSHQPLARSLQPVEVWLYSKERRKFEVY